MVRAGKALAAHGPQALQQARVDGGRRGRRRGAGRPRARLVRDRRARAGSARPASPTTPGRSPTTRSRSSSRERPRATSACSRSAPQSSPPAARRSRRAPTTTPCPLPEGDWCHFATRLARSRTHRLAKGAERGFEDEKFAYVVLTRSPHPAAAARVLRRPDLRPGHVVLDLCTADGLERRTVSKRDGADYRRARKVAWGDTL